MPIIFGIVQNNSIVINPGTINSWGGTTAPAGWLLCDGASLPQTGTYAALYAAIGGAFGTVGSFFNVPDLRGRFLRGVAGLTGITRDPDSGTRPFMNPGGNVNNAVGSVQADQFFSHIHTDSGHLHSLFGTGPGVQFPGGTADCGMNQGATANTVALGANAIRNGIANIQPNGGSETRPLNAYTNFIIKY
jgi:microcystin-dependent protein